MSDNAKKGARPKIEQQLTDDPLEPDAANPSLNSEIRAATTIQSSVTPEDYPAAELEAHGLRAKGWIPADMPLALIELPEGDGPALHHLGGPNFYVVTRYNWSSYYALAVIELGQAVAAALRSGCAPASLAWPMAQASTMPSNTGCNASTQ